MMHTPDSPWPEVANTMAGTVSGSAIQAGKIEGGVHQHYHDHRPMRASVSLPYRVGVVPPRAA